MELGQFVWQNTWNRVKIDFHPSKQFDECLVKPNMYVNKNFKTALPVHATCLETCLLQIANA